jgi:hypothetical protein
LIRAFSVGFKSLNMFRIQAHTTFRIVSVPATGQLLSRWHKWGSLREDFIFSPKGNDREQPVVFVCAEDKEGNV